MVRSPTAGVLAGDCLGIGPMGVYMMAGIQGHRCKGHAGGGSCAIDALASGPDLSIASHTLHSHAAIAMRHESDSTHLGAGPHAQTAVPVVQAAHEPEHTSRIMQGAATVTHHTLRCPS